MDEVLEEWKFVRSETLDLLSALNNKTILFVPEGDTWQPLYYQFACIARTQLVFAQALVSGVMDFRAFADPNLPNKHEYKTIEQLQSLLNEAEKTWQEAIVSGKAEVQWPNGSKSKLAHLYRLVSHERLHHGQMISYFTLAGITLPRDFKQNWAL